MTQSPTRQARPPDHGEVVVVTRWKRSGHDRAHARLGELDLGFRDLVTGATVCLAAGHEVTLQRATDELWQRARAARYATRHAAADTGTPPRQTLVPDRDLAPNRPGEAVDAQAKALRDAPPVRSRVDRLLGRRTGERSRRTAR